jgi:catecholate siderophore receptor
MDTLNMLRRLLTAFTATAILLAPLGLKAQEAPDRTLAEVVVTDAAADTPSQRGTGLKLDLSAMDTPASVGVVTADVIEAQGANVLGDALRNTAGVNIQSGFGVHDLFYVRGFESLTGGLVLTDGAVEPEVSFYNLYNVERVETLRGPAAFLYGGNPLSGAVNLVRKAPRFANFGSFNVSYGAFQTNRGTVDLGWSEGDEIAFRLNGLWRDSENYRDDKDNTTIAINPSLRWRADDNVTIDLSFEYADMEYISDSGLPLVNGALPPDVPRTQSYQSPFDISEQTTLRARFGLTAELSDSVTLRNRAYFTDLDWLTDGTLFVGAFPIESGAWHTARTLTSLDDEQRVQGNQLEALIRFETGALAHTVLAGVEVTHLTDAFSLDVALLPTVDIFDPVETATQPVSPIPGALQAVDATTLVAAPYLIDRVELSDQVDVFLGGRHDWVDYEDDVSGLQRDYAQFSPMVGALYAPTSDLSVYANFGRAFAPPSSRVLGEVEAEESTQVEFGTKHVLMDGKAHAALAVYSLERDITIPDNSQITEQLGTQRSRGVEVQVEARPDDTLTVALAYAFNDSEYTEFSQTVVTQTAEGFDVQTVDRTGMTPAFAPEHILNLWAEKRLDNGFGLSFGARYVGEQFLSEQNLFVIDGVLTLDVGVSYIFEDVVWRLNVRNLTDQEYLMRGFGEYSVIPADPISVYSSLGWSL